MWDAYKCHMTSSVRAVVDRETQSDMIVIPGGLTRRVIFNQQMLVETSPSRRRTRNCTVNG